MHTSAVILAGGAGKRMGAGTPKQFREIGGYPLIWYSLKAFQDSFVDEIVLVCRKVDLDFCSNDIVDKYGFTKVKTIVPGGAERYHSVYNGLKALRCVAEGENREPGDIVFIHDGARPFVNEDILKRAFDAAVADHAAVVAVPAKDTVKIAGNDDFAEETLPRDRLWLVQTPQVFDFYDIYEAYGRLIGSEEELLEKGVQVTDDAMVLELFSDKKSRLVMGDYKNIKVTTPDDILLAEAILKGNEK